MAEAAIFTWEGTNRQGKLIRGEITAASIEAVKAELRKQGVTVQYIPYPRRGVDGAGYQQLAAIWCAKNPTEALSEYIDGLGVPAAVGRCDRAVAVESGYRLGNSLGITGTPLLILQNGERIRGYKKAAQVLSRMGLGD